MLFSYRKIGGLRFIRLGRLQLSFCIVRKKPVPRILPGRFYPAYTPAQAAAYRASFNRLCDDMSSGN